MKKANAITQGILLGISFLVIFFSFFFTRRYDGSFRLDEVLIFTALVQFFVGLYQLINAIIVTIRKAVKKQLNDYLKIYWLAVLIYFVIGVMLGVLIEFYLKGSMPHENSDKLYAYWFVSAWAIAIYYFVITIKDWQDSQNTNRQNA